MLQNEVLVPKRRVYTLSTLLLLGVIVDGAVGYAQLLADLAQVPCWRARADKRTLKLGQGGYDVENQLARRRGGISVFLLGDEVPAQALKFLQAIDQRLRGAGKFAKAVFLPRMCALADQRLYKTCGQDCTYSDLRFTGTRNPDYIRRHRDELLRLAGSN